MRAITILIILFWVMLIVVVLKLMAWADTGMHGDKSVIETPELWNNEW